MGPTTADGKATARPSFKERNLGRRHCSILNRRDLRTAIVFEDEVVESCAGTNSRFSCGGYDAQERDNFSSVSGVSQLPPRERCRT